MATTVKAASSPGVTTNGMLPSAAIQVAQLGRKPGTRVDLPVEPLDDVLRRAARRAEAEPERWPRSPRTKLPCRRHAGMLRDRRGAGDRERP